MKALLERDTDMKETNPGMDGIGDFSNVELVEALPSDQQATVNECIHQNNQVIFQLTKKVREVKFKIKKLLEEAARKQAAAS